MDSLAQILHYYRLPVIVLCFGIGLSIISFVLTLSYNTNQIKKDFFTVSNSLHAQLSQHFSSYVHANEILQLKLQSSLPFAQDAFAKIASELPEASSTAFLWTPRNENGLYTIELAYAAEGVILPEPLAAENYSGLIKHLQPLVLDTSYKAVELLQFFPHKKDRSDLAFILPVFANSDLEGYVISILDLAQLFAKELPKSTEPAINVFIYKNTEAGKKLIYYRDETGHHFTPAKHYAYETIRRISPFYFEQTLPFNGNSWHIVFVPSHHHLAGTIGVFPWAILLGCILLSGVVSLFIFSLTTRNITIQRSVEEQTRELSQLTQNLLDSDERIRAVVDNTVDGIITIDEYGNIESYNKACVRIFGYSAEEVIGQNVKMLMPEPYHSEHDGYLKNYRETGEKKIIGIGREVQGRRKDGSVFPIDLSVSEVRLQGKRLFSGIVRDITIVKQVERERQRYISALERSNKELDDFAYIASHDLKEPLRGLHNHSRFLLEDNEGKLDEDSTKRLHRLIYLTQRMEKLINDLLYFSRLGRQTMAIQPTDLNKVIHDIEITLEHFIEEHNGRIVLPSHLPVFTCDKTRITEVFRNLITNALKYNNSPEKIVEIGFLKEHPSPEGVMLRNVFYVKDNGVGIPPEFQSEVFRIFRRLQSTKGTEEGTGVGLTFVKKIVERHNGTIWLESEPGKGTTFYFSLEGTVYASDTPQ